MIIQNVKRAAIYARISKSDADTDKVENQINELRSVADGCGYVVVAVFEDDDISAYGGKKVRPGWAALISAIESRQFDVVMATEASRFTRDSRTELDYFTATCIKAETTIHTRAGGVVDPSTPSALAMLQIMDVVSGLEVALKIERQKARNRADLAAGIPTKGLRPFGWEKDRITIREEEAKHVRKAFADILERGKSVWGVAQEWNGLGLKTQAMMTVRKSRADGEVKLPSGIWTTTTVRDVLRRPRNAGILMADGAEMPHSRIHAIVSRQSWEALCASIKGTPAAKGPRPQYLLGGLLECICGQRMHASKSRSGRTAAQKRDYKIYRCRVYGFDKSQKHVAIQLHIADKKVSEWVVEDIGLSLADFKPFDSEALGELDNILIAIARSDSDLSTLVSQGLGNGDEIRGLMRKNKSQRELVGLSRQAILATAAQSTALEKFKLTMTKLPDYAAEQEINKALEQGMRAWNELSIDSRRAIIRGDFRVQVLQGGRGEERILVSSRNS
jgi:DNA invertase Pin-like site-specific DNA recombinase